jgi:Amt family ammonium transporter
MMTSTALVLFMTLPGLALFYGGLVRRKNVLSVLAQCYGTTGLVTILWWAIGYSLVFSPNASYAKDAKGVGQGWSILGDSSYAFFKTVNSTPNTALDAYAGQNVYAMFQLTFAIITPALIIGAVAERIKFSAIMIFLGCWMFVVYFPLAHAVWGPDGWLAGGLNASNAPYPALDYAGGTVVHMSSGYSALVLALILGRRSGYGKTHFTPHSPVLVMVGSAILWVGWYGFNAGSAGAADICAANAFTTTTLATAVASFVWATMEFFFRGKATVVGFSSGAVAGLVVITPACGYVNANGGMIIGVVAGVIPFLAATYLKALLKYDDALDVFGVHAIGGTCGSICTGLLADPASNPVLAAAPGATPNNMQLAVAHGTQIYYQFADIGFTIVLAVVGTTVIAYALKFTIGLRPTSEQEETGLDLTDHGEEGYIL